MKNANEKMNNHQVTHKENELFDKILMTKDSKENDSKYINSNYFSKSLHNFSENISKNKINTDKQYNFFSSKKTRDKGSYIGILESYLTNSSQENNTNSKKEHYIDSDNINMDKNYNNNDKIDKLNIVKENAHSLCHLNDNIKKDSIIKQNVINCETNQNFKQINSCENNNIVNKNFQTEEKSKYFISNISSIDNERNNNSKNKFLKRKSKTNEEVKNAENNIINVEINNESMIDDEKDLEKSIFKVNYIKPNKKYEISQLIKCNDTEDNINNKYNQLIQNKSNKSKSQKYIDYINDDDKENCFKNKINEYMNLLKDENKVNNKANKSCNMRLKILDRKIRNSKNKYNNFETEEKAINKLDYHKLKRYKNYSCSYLNRFQKKENKLNSNDINIRREAKINIIKNEINKMNFISKDISDIKANNTGKQNNQNIRTLQQFKRIGNMENIYRSIIGQNSINNTRHFDNILNGLNIAINKLPKYLKQDNIDNIDKISKTSTSRTYQISMNNLINGNYGNDFQNNIFKKENKIHSLECNEKNEKIKCESKVNNMNCTLNKLLYKIPDFNSQTMGTQPANIFNKYKSISKTSFLQKNKTSLFL